MKYMVFYKQLLLLIFSLLWVSVCGQDFQTERKTMIVEQLIKRGISSPAVLKAMDVVPRHLFVSTDQRTMAYVDGPLPIGHGQTISQPYMVALMSQTLNLDAGSRVLEIGTGSGYQAAVLAEMDMEVYSIELIPELAEQATKNLELAGFSKVKIRTGDGYKGWPEEAPFDGIILTAAPEQIPQKLIEQLKSGGTMVLPVGAINQVQTLKKLTKTADGVTETDLVKVRFVPMVRGKN